MITGFLSNAQGYEQGKVNLNSLLVQHPSSTVFMQVSSSGYENMGIYNGDILIVDRAKPINPNSFVVYESEGKYVVGRAFRIKGEAFVAGTVLYVIHKVKG